MGVYICLLTEKTLESVENVYNIVLLQNIYKCFTVDALPGDHYVFSCVSTMKSLN